MAQKKLTLSQLRVGLLALASIVILIVFILAVTGDISIFSNLMTVRTRFAAADGLKAGDEVRLAGVRVGQVTSIDFMPGIPQSPNEKTIEVTMKLDAEEVRNRIRTDSQAVLGQQGFLGDRVIDITAGTSQGTPVQDGGEIPSADVAGLAQVFTGASDLLVVFNTVGKQLENLVKDINEGKGTIGRLLKDDTFYTNLNRTAVEAQALLKNIQQGKGTVAKLLNDPTLYNDIRSLTNDLKSLTDNLREGRGTAGKLLTDDQVYNRANEAMARINSSLEKFDRIVEDIEAGRGTLGKFVKDEKLHNDLQSTVESVRNISTRLERGEGTAGKLLQDDKLYNNANQMSAELVKLLYDFRQNPRKYLSIKVSLF